MPKKVVWSGLAVLLLTIVPLFICLPLNSDTALFDLQAAVSRDGGVLYRDVIEPNLPGTVWLHSAIRAAVGWSSEAMRAVDLLIFAGILALCCALLQRTESSSRPADAKRLFVTFATLFYLSMNEWCHAQRDTWMLLPALAAVLLRACRAKGTASLASSTVPGCVREGVGSLFRLDAGMFYLAVSPKKTPDPLDSTWDSVKWDSRTSAVLEGVCWGAAFWIKPHVAVPAVAVIAADLMFRTTRRHVVREVLAVISGGILIAIPGILWLIATGAWPHFCDMMLNWNPEYLAAGAERKDLQRWLLMADRFRPWWIVHMVAIPLSVRSLCQRLIDSDADQSIGRDDRSRRLLSAIYVGWLLQSFGLQHAMDYIHVPALVLGLAVIAGWNWRLDVSLRRVTVAAFLLLAVLASPMLQPKRLASWTSCWQHGSSPQIRATLAHGNFPDWQHLSNVVEFLESQNVQDGQLTCANVHSVHIYNALNVRPATRYWSVTILRELFRHRTQLIDATLRDSGQRFLVVEDLEQGLARGSDELPCAQHASVVFRSGTYTVYADAAS